MDERYSKKLEMTMRADLLAKMQSAPPTILVTLPLFRPKTIADPGILLRFHQLALKRLHSDVKNVVFRAAIGSKHYKRKEEYLAYLIRTETKNKRGGDVHPHIHAGFWLTLQQFKRFGAREDYVQKSLEDLLRKRRFRRDVHIVDYRSGKTDYLLKFPLDDILGMSYYNMTDVPDQEC